MSFCFTSGEGTAQNAKAIFHRLMMRGAVNVDYQLGLTSSLGLTQEIRGPIQQIVTQPLGLTQTVTPQHAVPYGASSNLGITQIVVHAGAFGGGGGGNAPIEATFDDTATVGNVVFIKPTGNAGLADQVTNFRAVGVSNSDVSAGNTGTYITEGLVERDNWTAIVGTALLTPGVVYYLALTAGGITITPPTTGGKYVVAIGRATSTTALDVEIAEPILL